MSRHNDDDVLSSSDDDEFDLALLKKSAFRKPSRQQDRAKAKRDNILDRLVESRQEDLNQSVQLAQMEKEEKEKEIQSTSKKQRKEEDPVPEDIVTIDAGLSGVGSSALSLLQTRRTLFQTQVHLPTTKRAALECLQQIVDGQDSDVIAEIVGGALHDDSLEAELMRPSWRRHVLQKLRNHSLPHAFAQWLFMMSCCQNEELTKLAWGAFGFLMETIDDKAVKVDTPIGHLEQHLCHYFGLSSVQDKKAGSHRNRSLNTAAQAALLRWLQLWDKALETSKPDEKSLDTHHLFTALTSLVVAASDPLIAEW